MKRRPRRSLAATLTALVLLAGCVLVAVVAVQLILGKRPWISVEAVASWLHGQRWTDLLPAAAGGIAALLGLVLLLAAALPGAATVLPVEGGPFEAGVARAGYRSTLRAAAAAVDGASAAAVKLTARRVKVRVTTARTRPDGLADAVREAVGHRLDQIRPANRPTVSVRVRAPRRSS
ncbi:DUF6286 domain-containing protein [Amycolatopsis sp. NPDC049159]|uniref:DUF6286 domain-containing protein n=1 Tax=Amycolatopsis sp. NPDC049159 TaxID=3157210 RepID=UPI0033E2E70D